MSRNVKMCTDNKEFPSTKYSDHGKHVLAATKVFETGLLDCFLIFKPNLTSLLGNIKFPFMLNIIIHPTKVFSSIQCSASTALDMRGMESNSRQQVTMKFTLVLQRYLISKKEWHNLKKMIPSLDISISVHCMDLKEDGKKYPKVPMITFRMAIS